MMDVAPSMECIGLIAGNGIYPETLSAVARRVGVNGLVASVS